MPKPCWTVESPMLATRTSSVRKLLSTVVVGNLVVLRTTLPCCPPKFLARFVADTFVYRSKVDML